METREVRPPQGTLRQTPAVAEKPEAFRRPALPARTGDEKFFPLETARGPAEEWAGTGQTDRRPMGIAERRERERTEVRDKIMDAARKLFVEHGYEAVSMRMIAREIEYSPTAIYFHFKDKEALFQELCACDFMALSGAFVKMSRMEDPVERLRAIGTAYAEFAIGYPNHYRLMFMTPTPPMEPNSQVRRGNPEEDAYAFLRATVGDGIRAGRFRAELGDEEALAQLMWAGVHGVVSLRIAKGEDPWVQWAPERPAVQQMIDTLVRGITRPDA